MVCQIEKDTLSGTPKEKVENPWFKYYLALFWTMFNPPFAFLRSP